MPLSEDDARGVVADLLRKREAESERLDPIHTYMRGNQNKIYSPRKTTQEYQQIVKMSKVNILPLPVTVFTQNLFADGYRGKREAVDKAVWQVWQDNRMDLRQSLLYRSAITYSLSYATVLKKRGGGALITPFSPRSLTAVYDDPVNDEWPVYAITCADGYDATTRKPVMRYTLFDKEWVYRFTKDASGKLTYVGESDDPARSSGAHGLPECPVVRYVNVGEDLDDGPVSEVEPLMDLQDQLNNTTYALLIKQQFQAFRQRYVTNMTVEEDANGTPIEPYKGGVDRVWVATGDSKFGEFEEGNLQGLLDSRQSTLMIIAVLAQISPHALLTSNGVSNLSAEALAALESSQQRKQAGMKTSFGESNEQLLRLAGKAAGVDGAWEDTTSQIVWRDTESRSLAQAADAAGKLAPLSMPPEFLWEKVGDWLGWSQQDLDRLKDLADKEDGLKDQLNQAIPPAPPPEQLIGQGAPNVVPAGPARPTGAARAARKAVPAGA